MNHNKKVDFCMDILPWLIVLIMAGFAIASLIVIWQAL
jgi:hypothetical protein